MAEWLENSSFEKKDIEIDNYKYEVFLKKKRSLPISAVRIVVVSFQPNKDASKLLELCIKSIRKFTGID